MKVAIKIKLPKIVKKNDMSYFDGKETRIGQYKINKYFSKLLSYKIMKKGEALNFRRGG